MNAAKAPIGLKNVKSERRRREDSYGLKIVEGERRRREDSHCYKKITPKRKLNLKIQKLTQTRSANNEFLDSAKRGHRNSYFNMRYVVYKPH